MSKGWIYLKKMTDHNGYPTAYCFGLTSRPEKRKRAYRKENPFIVHLEDFQTPDMKAAEDELIAEVKRRRWLLRDNSDEWIKASCFDDFKTIWNRVKDKHSIQGVRKRKAIKRRRRQAVHGMDVMGDPMTQKQKRDRERDTTRRRLLDEAAAIRQQKQFMEPPLPRDRQAAIDHAKHLATCSVPAEKQTSAFWQAMGEAMVIGGGSLLGLMALAGIAVNMPSIISFLGTVISMVLVLGFLWLLGTVSGAGKRKRRKAW